MRISWLDGIYPEVIGDMCNLLYAFCLIIWTCMGTEHNFFLGRTVPQSEIATRDYALLDPHNDDVDVIHNCVKTQAPFCIFSLHTTII